MNLLRKIRLFPLLVFVFSVVFSASVISCGQKAENSENSEHPADEAGESEHPEGNQEHPAEDSDSTKAEQQ